MIIIIAVIILIVFTIVIAAVGTKKKADNKPSQSKKLKEKPPINMLNREGDPYEDEWHTYIAGLVHHISKYDIGGFAGWVEADRFNKVDPDAMGVYNSFGKLLGYIPAQEVKNYKSWCDGLPQPCVGFIFIEDDKLRGRVKVLRPCNKEFLETEFSYYLQWVYDNYGKAYLPKNMSFQFETE